MPLTIEDFNQSFKFKTTKGEAYAKYEFKLDPSDSFPECLGYTTKHGEYYGNVYKSKEGLTVVFHEFGARHKQLLDLSKFEKI